MTVPGLARLIEAHAVAPSSTRRPEAHDDDEEDDEPAIVDITDAMERQRLDAREQNRHVSRGGSSTVVLENDPDLDGAKGYVKRADGTTTTYFDRGTAHQITPSVPVPLPPKLGERGAEAAVSSSLWNAAGTFEERDVSEWAADRLGGMVGLIEYDEDRELVIDECRAVSVEVRRASRRCAAPAGDAPRSTCGQRQRCVGGGRLPLACVPAACYNAFPTPPHPCPDVTMQGTATIFTARGKTKNLFELRFDVEWTASIRSTASKLCEGSLRCEASNTEGAPSLEAKAFLRTQVSSRDHGLRAIAVAEGGLKDEVMAAVRRFATALAEKANCG